MGWQDLHPLIRKAYQSKGGSVKKPKGFAMMDKNRHLTVSSQGGKNKFENISNKAEDEIKKNQSSSVATLEEVLNTLNEEL